MNYDFSELPYPNWLIGSKRQAIGVLELVIELILECFSVKHLCI